MQDPLARLVERLLARRSSRRAPNAPPSHAPTALTAQPPETTAAGFRDRSRLRRRLRYLRRTRELALRDLGGFMFDQHRFGRERADIVKAKLEGIAAIDHELRVLERALDDRRELLVLREPGISVCPRCATLHSSDARFCPGCALPRESGAGLPLGPAPPRPVGAGDRPLESTDGVTSTTEAGRERHGDAA